MTRTTPGRFLALRLTLPARLEEAAVAAFWEAGCLGVEVVSISRSRLDPRVRLRVYFPGAQPRRSLGRRIDRSLRAFGVHLPRSPGLVEVQDRNWARAWQRSLRPMAIARRFLVVPEGCRAEAARGRLRITVRYGQAFGTGEHASTRACLRLLESSLVRGDRVVDLGTGTAILAMAAVLLGAGRVIAVDEDEVAIRVAAGNLAANGLAGRVTLMRADAAEACRLGPFDLALVNIGASVIARLLPNLAAALAPDGQAVLAGILIEDERPLLAHASTLGLRPVRRIRSRPWSALLLRRSTGA